MSDSGSGDFVHPTAITAWQLIGGALGVVAIGVFAMWTIVTNEANNNRLIADDLKANYVTKSNHNDLVDRFNREVSRVDSVNARLDTDMLPRKEFDRWKTERDDLVKDIQRRLSKLEQDSVSNSRFDSVVNERGRRIEELREDLRRVVEQEERRHQGISERLNLLFPPKREKPPPLD